MEAVGKHKYLSEFLLIMANEMDSEAAREEQQLPGICRSVSEVCVKSNLNTVIIYGPNLWR